LGKPTRILVRSCRLTRAADHALQRAATIVLQKVGARASGWAPPRRCGRQSPSSAASRRLPLQILRRTGYLVSLVEGAAFRLRHLLNAPELNRAHGAAGR